MKGTFWLRILGIITAIGIGIGGYMLGLTPHHNDVMFQKNMLENLTLTDTVVNDKYGNEIKVWLDERNQKIIYAVYNKKGQIVFITAIDIK